MLFIYFLFVIVYMYLYNFFLSKKVPKYKKNLYTVSFIYIIHFEKKVHLYAFRK